MATKEQAYEYANQLGYTTMPIANRKGHWNSGRIAIVGFRNRGQITDCIDALGGQHEIFRYTEDALSLISMGLAEDFKVPKGERHPAEDMRFIVGDAMYVPGVAV